METVEKVSNEIEKRMIISNNLYRILIEKANPTNKAGKLKLNTPIIQKCFQPTIRELDNSEAVLILVTSRITEIDTKRCNYQYFYLQARCGKGTMCDVQYYVLLKNKPTSDSEYVGKILLKKCNLNKKF